MLGLLSRVRAVLEAGAGRAQWQPRGDLPVALAEYNAGRSNVLRWNKGAAATNSRVFIKQIDFPGTKSYVLSVMTRYAEYLPKYGISTRSRVETVSRD